MKAVILEADAVNHNDLSWEPVTSLVETTIYGNTTEEDKFQHIKDADIILSNKVKFDDAVFEKCPNIKYIGVCATGYNVIDLEAASRHGVTVTNVPAYSTDSVVQLAWGFILETFCHIGMHNESVHRGDWIKSDVFCYWLCPIAELTGKTIGIVGYGNIGRRMAEIASAFHMNTIVNTAHPEKYKKDNNVGCTFVDIETLFAKADVISLHCPLTNDTSKMINKHNIDKMKDGVVLINVSRGGLVVEGDLAYALKCGKVSAAACDVVEEEPMIPGNPLLTAPNMTITPHMGWASIEARTRLVDTVAANLRAFLEDRQENVVNP